MEKVKLNYYKGSIIPELNHDPRLFFEMQDIIKEDFLRLKYMVENYEDSKSKDNLINRLNNVIKNIQLNRFEKGPSMQLNIYIKEDYLVFSYYNFDKKTKKDRIPTIVIVPRNLKKIYFVDELEIIFEDVQNNSSYNLCHDEIECFQLNENNINQYNVESSEATIDLFFNCFENTDLFIDNIESDITLIKKLYNR